MLRIESEELRVDIKEEGAELHSVFDKTRGQELLWQGGALWKEQAPVLFPFIGRLQGKHYFYNEKKYPMSLHGFARENVFRIVECEEDSCILELRDTAVTRQSYPFSFRLRQEYRVEGKRLFIETKVENLGVETLYFGLGLHPGFQLFTPEEKISEFEVYFPELGDRKPEQILFSKDCLTKKEKGKNPLEGNLLSLSSALFKKDAVVLSETNGVLCIRKKGEERGLYLEYPDYPYIGFWQPYGKDAPFLCLEPWTSLPGRDGVEEDIAKKEDFLSLLPEEEKSFHCTIQLQ